MFSKSQFKKKKNYIRYIVLVFKLCCTYNNCRGFAPFLYHRPPKPSSPHNRRFQGRSNPHPDARQGSNPRP